MPISERTVAAQRCARYPTPLPERARAALRRAEALVESYRRLAEVFHDVLSEQSPEALLDRIADTLAELVPYQDLHIYEADEQRRELVPVFARSAWAEEILSRARSSSARGSPAGRSSTAAPCSRTTRTSIRASRSCPGRRPTRRR